MGRRNKGVNMNARQTASLAFRLMGIYAIINSIGFLRSFLSSYSFQNPDQEFSRQLYEALHLIPFLALVGLGVVLIRYGGVYAAKMFDCNELETSSELDCAKLHSVLISILGLYLMLTYFVTLLGVIGSFFSFSRQSFFDSQEQGNLVSSIIEFFKPYLLHLIIGFINFLLGFIFFFRSSRVVRFWKKFQKDDSTDKAITADEAEQHCPVCGHPFKYSDYRDGLDEYFCSKCREKLPSDIIRRD